MLRGCRGRGVWYGGVGCGNDEVEDIYAWTFWCGPFGVDLLID